MLAIQILADKESQSSNVDFPLLQWIATTDDSDAVRIAEISIIGNRFGSGAAASWLTDVLDSDASAPIRSAALIALNSISIMGDEFVSKLCGMMTEDRHLSVRKDAFTAVSRRCTESPEFQAQAKSMARSDADSTMRQLATEFVIRAAPKDSELVDWAVGIVDTEQDPEISAMVLQQVINSKSVRSEMVEKIRPRMAHKVDSAIALAAVLDDFGESESLSEAFLDSDVFEVRFVYLQLAGLKARFSDSRPPVVPAMRALSDGEKSIRGIAGQIISQSWDGDANQLSRLMDLVADESIVDVRQKVVSGFASCATPSEELDSWLQEVATGDPAEIVRSSAAKSLLARAPGRPIAFEVLSALIPTASPGVRGICAVAIAAAWIDHPAALRYLIDWATGDPDLEVRRAAVMALAAPWQNTEAVTQTLLKVAKDDENGSVRCLAVQALFRSWREEPSVAAALPDFVVGADVEVRDLAWELSGSFLPLAVAPLIAKIVEEHGVECRRSPNSPGLRLM